MRRALIERVVRELASFERPSASPGERRAAEWLAGELRAAGCEARIEAEPAHGGYWWPIGLLNAACLLASLAGRRVLAALVGAFAAAAVWDDTGGGRQWFRRAALPHGSTWNVVAETGDRGRPSGRSCSSPTTTPPTAGSCSTRPCRGSACASLRASTRRPTRASRSCSASSSARCSRRSAASRGGWGSGVSAGSSPPGPPRPWRTSAPAPWCPGPTTTSAPWARSWPWPTPCASGPCPACG